MIANGDEPKVRSIFPLEKLHSVTEPRTTIRSFAIAPGNVRLAAAARLAGFDTAESEPFNFLLSFFLLFKNLQKFAKFCKSSKTK